MNKKVEDFFNGMSYKDKSRFVHFSKGYNFFLLEENYSSDNNKDIVVVFNNDKEIFKLNEYGKNIITSGSRDYSLIITSSESMLDRGFYNVADVPFFIDEESQEQETTVNFADLAIMPTIKQTNQLQYFFDEIIDHLSFNSLNEKAYKDDVSLKVQTIYKSDKSNLDCEFFVNRIVFNDDIVMYIDHYDYTSFSRHIVDKDAYLNLLNYLEENYNKKEIMIEQLDSLIYKKMSYGFYNFMKQELGK